MKNKVLIIGANGFIGSTLVKKLINDKSDQPIIGVDLYDNNLSEVTNDRFIFYRMDITKNRRKLEQLITESDIVIPLTAIANPSLYIKQALKTFQLTFEENLRIIRLCHKHGRRVIVFSTSEVYGMCQDSFFDEHTSPLVVGPTENQRWIYSASKQLLDRVVCALGFEGLHYTIVRPFNWIGNNMDVNDLTKGETVRLLPNLIDCLLNGKPITLVNSGQQKRCFIDIDEALECFIRIIDNPDHKCDAQIINIGSLKNELSVEEFAQKVIQLFDSHPLRHLFPPSVGFQIEDGESYYGKGYEDVRERRPSTRMALACCGWEATRSIDQAIKNAIHESIRKKRCKN